MKTVTFYHSIVCPRCHFSKLMLSQVLKEFPAIEINKVELLRNSKRAKGEGVKSVPTLVYGEHKLSGVVFTKGALRRFFNGL